MSKPRLGVDRVILIIGALVCAFVAGFVVQLLTGSPWVLWGAAVALATAASATFMPWAMSFGLAVTAPLVVAVVVARIVPLHTFEWSATATGVVLAIGLISSGVLAARHGKVRPVSGVTRRVAWGALPVGGLLVIAAVIVSASRGAFVSWAMRNDAAWNTMLARFVIEDGGLDAVNRPNPAPATSVLLASAGAPGRASVPGADLLLHDITRQAVLWLLLLAVAVVLTAAILAPHVRTLRPGAASVVVALGTLLPVSWFVFGFAAQFGFYNATLSLILLSVMWVAWQRFDAAPWASLGVMALSLLAIVATWAPLALLPAALLVAAGVRMLRGTAPAQRGRSILILAAIAAPLAAYGMLVTLPDLLREGSALAVDGGIMPYLGVGAIVFALFAAGVSCAHGSLGHDVTTARGMMILVGAAGLGTAYLVVQRLGLVPLWGYYPAKFAWIVMTLLVVILFGMLVDLVTAAPRGASRALATLAAALSLASIMTVVPPTRAALPGIVSVLRHDGLSYPAEVTVALFEAAPDQPTLVSRLFGPYGDLLMNSWLLQTRVESGDDPTRAYAFVLNGDDPNWVCEAAAASGGDVTVLTAEAAVADQLASCEAVTDVVVR